FSRLGPYNPALVDDAAWSHTTRQPRLLVEYWAHAACLLPVDDWPLLRWRMRRWQQRYRADPNSVANTAPQLAEQVLQTVRELGPIGAGALEDALGIESSTGKGGWWNRSQVKWVCEWLFAIGELSTATRVGFERRYDLTERVVPAAVLARPEADEADAVRELTARAARAYGIATEPDLRDYYRLRPRESRRAVDELVAEGVLEPVLVPGWRDAAYRHRVARTPRSITGRAMLSPFDPVVWNRDRAERLFDFHYRIEIYVPQAQRQYGYYVFPFLLDGRLVGRVDLKADRQRGVLLVPGAFAEPDTDPSRITAELAAELRVMAEWLGLTAVEVGERGNLASRLTRVLG